MKWYNMIGYDSTWCSYRSLTISFILHNHFLPVPLSSSLTLYLFRPLSLYLWTYPLYSLTSSIYSPFPFPFFFLSFIEHYTHLTTPHHTTQAGHSKLVQTPGSHQTIITGNGGPSGTGKRCTSEPVLPPPVFLQDILPGNFH